MGSKTVIMIALISGGLLTIAGLAGRFFSPENHSAVPIVHEIKSGLTISISDSSLPMAALDELEMSFEDPIEQLVWSFPEEAEVLQSGIAFNFAQPQIQVVELAPVKVIVPRKVNPPQRVRPLRKPRSRERVLHPKLRSRKRVITPTNQQSQIKIEELAKVASVTQDSISNGGESKESIEPAPIITGFTLPVGATAIGSVSSVATSQKIIPTSNGGSIIVQSASQSPELNSTSNSALTNAAAKTEIAISSQPLAAKISTNSSSQTNSSNTSEEDSESESLSESDSSTGEQSNDSTIEPLAGPVKISGELEMVGGLAYSASGDEIVVFRELEGTIVEEAQIWLRKGKYEIELSDGEGILIAQLRNSEGYLLGEATYSLLRLHDKTGSFEDGLDHYAGIDLQVRPIVQGIIGKVISAYSFENNDLPVTEPQVLSSIFDEYLPIADDGNFHVDHVVKRARYQIKASARNHWGTLVVGNSGHFQKIKMFPDKMIQALVELSHGDLDPAIEEYGIVWGRVIENGEPVEGAKVELIGEDLRPIYFQAMLPDTNMISTGKNGLFAFIGVSPGLQQVQANVAGRFLQPTTFSAEPRHVSSVTIEKKPTHKIPVRVFDAFETGMPLPAVLRVVGDENLHEVDHSGFAKIEVQSDQQLMFVEASSFEDYESVRLLAPRSRGFVHLPLVSSDWMADIVDQSGVEVRGELGSVIGFVNGHEKFETYEVFLGSDGVSNDHSVVYFNAQGEIIEEGEAGGGFIILNVESGLQTVVVNPNDPFDVSSQVIYSEPGVLSLFQQSYR